MPFVCIHIRIGTMTKDLLPKDKSLKKMKKITENHGKIVFFFPKNAKNMPENYQK